MPTMTIGSAAGLVIANALAVPGQWATPDSGRHDWRFEYYSKRFGASSVLNICQGVAWVATIPLAKDGCGIQHRRLCRVNAGRSPPPAGLRRGTAARFGPDGAAAGPPGAG